MTAQLQSAMIEMPNEINVSVADKYKGIAPRRILVVDDEDIISALNSKILIAAGYRVDIAKDGEAGWNMIMANAHDSKGFDLMITDNNMPKLTGVNLIKRLRSARLNVPIILASGNIPMGVESLQLAAILQKPYLAAELVQAVNEILNPGRA